MSFLDKVLRCNARKVSRYLAFTIDGRRYGYITPERMALLAKFPDVFEVKTASVGLQTALDTPVRRTQAVNAIGPALAATGAFALKGEMYAVKNDWHEREAMRLDRSLVPGFGARAYGVHVNGFVRKADGLHLWIGTRSDTVNVEPGKLDNMVAGGQPAGLSLTDNLVKECAEEASLPEALARTAKPVGSITYSFDAPEGLKVDNLFCFDLEMPEGMTPKNSDGEFAGYQLLPVEEVLAGVRDTNRYKFNVNLVILDFAIRHGIVSPETEPDYERIVSGLHEKP
ncbi:MAG: DUF4743 domain-containing protein [Rhodospirillaceae bacterium]|nr:DUF4743 domain-containing protein [Rhodospirillaceae bacterium]